MDKVTVNDVVRTTRDIDLYRTLWDACVINTCTHQQKSAAANSEGNKFIYNSKSAEN